MKIIIGTFKKRTNLNMYEKYKEHNDKIMKLKIITQYILWSKGNVEKSMKIWRPS